MAGGVPGPGCVPGPGGCVPGPRGVCTWSQGGVYLVPGGCTWSRGYLIPGGVRTWSCRGVFGPGVTWNKGVHEKEEHWTSRHTSKILLCRSAAGSALISYCC